MVAATLQSTTFARKFRLFLRWMKENRIEYTDNIVFELGGSESVADIGIKAVHDIQTNDLLANIPKEACLTIRTTAAARLIEEKLRGGLGLAVALMYERSLQERSKWFGYLQLIPLEQNLPFLWTLDKIDILLRGTELQKAVKDDKNLIVEDWEESIAPLSLQHPADFPAEWFTLDRYLAAKTIIASRAFGIDEYHGYGLVPLADLFNHKTAAEDVHFSKISDDSDGDGGTHAVSEDGKNGKGEERVSEDCSLDESDMFVQSMTTSEDDDNIFRMILVKDVAKGAEIFSTYGTLSNAALLHRYGFTEFDNPFDIVNIDWALINTTTRSIFSTRYVRRRMAFWRKVSCAIRVWDGHEDSYFEISADGEPEEDLLTLLYILHLPEETFDRLSTGWDRQLDKGEGVLAVAGALGLRGPRRKRRKTKFIQNNGKKIVLRGRTLHKNNMRCSLLTKPVRNIMQRLLAERDSLYPTASLDEDLAQLSKTSRVDQPELFHALTLRSSERTILKKCLEKMSQNK